MVFPLDLLLIISIPIHNLHERLSRPSPLTLIITAPQRTVLQLFFRHPKPVGHDQLQYYQNQPVQGGYAGQPMQGGYGGPPMQGGYGGPPMQQGGYYPPPPQQAYQQPGRASIWVTIKGKTLIILSSGIGW